MIYGPLLELFELSTRYCWGEAREVCYMLQLPIYAQLNFRNYITECFVHTVNLLSKWPLAFRKLLSNNCSINLSGKSGSGIELDAFVEAELVQPLKTYVSGNKRLCVIECSFLRTVGQVNVRTWLCEPGKHTNIESNECKRVILTGRVHYSTS
jgi:hypothetical protein